MGYLGQAIVKSNDKFRQLEDFSNVMFVDEQKYLLQPNETVYLITSADEPEKGFIISKNEITQFKKRLDEQVWIKTTTEDEVTITISD